MEIDVILNGQKKVSAKFKGLTISTDQPVDDGGSGSAPAPFDLFLASIATCAGFFIQSFCETRGISTQGIKIKQISTRSEKNHLVESIAIKITLPEEFPEKYRSAVIGAANGCSVKKHLQNPPKIEVLAESD